MRYLNRLWSRHPDMTKTAFNVATIVLIGTVLVTLLLLPLPFDQVEIEPGEVAPQDIVAPRRISYESDILTQEARDRASQAVADVYDPPQSRIRRQQVSQSRNVLDFITTVRSDSLALPETKIDYLLAIEGLDLSPELARQILELSDEEWQAVSREAPSVLDQVMREEIRDNSLPAVRRRISVLVSPDLNEDQNEITSELVRQLVRPNSFLNMERTEAEREAARESVPAQTVTLERNEIILRAGDIVTERDVEALRQMGLSQTEWTWWGLVQAIMVSVSLLALVVATIYRLSPKTLTSQRESGLLILLVTLGLVTARLMIVPHDWLPHLFPLAALSMLVALLLDVRVSVVLVLTFALLVGYLSNGNVELMYYVSVGALVGALVLGKAERLTSFLWAGLAVILSNLVVLVAMWSTPLESTSPSDILQMLLLVVVNGTLATSVALIGYFFLGSLFGITTSLQLMELSRPTHPLLRQLLLKAPGTYHHTILVSNLAERAAEAIGADAFLIRVGAYYHDIGKTVRPYFFAENVSDEGSPHEDLDPKTSAQIIISHVKDGVDLAQKYHLPEVLRDFIRQHHGAQIMTYFYQQAQKQSADGEAVDSEDFRYPGPDPRTKEATIMMLADVCEAAVRAERPSTRQELEDLVGKLITQRVLDGSLEHSELTFGELQEVKQIFLQVLQGVHHPRVKYPAEDTEEDETVSGRMVPDTGDYPSADTSAEQSPEKVNGHPSRAEEDRAPSPAREA